MRHAGFSLIEVMVTLVVLGIGLLGLAALQITGMRVNDGALMRTRAVMAAADLADRIRAQPAGFLDGGLEELGEVTLAADGCDNPPDCVDAVTCWQSDFCTRYQSADGPKELPPPAAGDVASIECTNAAGCGDGNCAIRIRWSDERAGVNDPGGGGDSEFRFCTRIPSAL
jgi:type IV pilus assembly protein PilV